MRIDFATLAFGYTVKSGGNTPNWSTSFGQGKEHKINQSEEINEIIKGLIYKSVSPEKISTPIGKGGSRYYGNTDDSPIVIGSVFTNVYINNVKIEDAKFILIVTRDTTPSHYGRLKLKYNPENQFRDANEDYKNWEFFKKAKKTLGLSEDACWFFTDLSIENQDTLKLTAVIVNKFASVTYEDADDLHNSWRELVPDLFENTEDSNAEATKYTNPLQIIYYGVPGCGKSHTITELLNDKSIFNIESEEEQVTRTIFHPDYTNSDFIGQIIPKVNDKIIEYEFVPGPFTKILSKALRNPKNQYALVIEEINRGNAAAIFGEIFQLLDRIKSGKTITEKAGDGNLNTYGEGWSEYFFMNDDINNYILREYNNDDSKSTALINGIAFSVNTGIRLPPNLSILATMNTSDQNVFTLDNAFQRRWDLKYISNKYPAENATKEQKNQNDSLIGETEITWGTFRTKINEKISSKEFSFSNAEDKQLGLFFIDVPVDISTSTGTIPEVDFTNKVLKYLWNDVFKHNHEDIFADKIDTFGDLSEKFTGKDAFEKTFKIDFGSSN